MNATDPENLAMFFITCYPEYGAYRGGRLIHDPVFVAYFTPTGAIPGYPIELFVVMISLGVVVVLIYKKNLKIKTNN